MKKHSFSCALIGASLCLAGHSAIADQQTDEVVVHGKPAEFLLANSRSPVGVMGDHMHEDGQWMMSYRYMHMSMSGNRDGTSDLSPTIIATTYANPFFGAPMQPPTLRVVPTDMAMNMHMLGIMYGLNRNVTFMLTGMYHEKSMDHITFMGGMGPTVLGRFTTKSKGFADTKLSTLVRLHESDTHDLHVNLGLSVPTGSVSETDQVLTPMNITPTLRLPYAMQLGSGTFDLEPGLTYAGNGHGNFGWGLTYRGVIRLGDNDEGYAFGDAHSIGANVSYLWAPWISTSLRTTVKSVGVIDGQDAAIMAPVQTADPSNYGGETADFSFGVNLSGTTSTLQGHRLGLEVTVPVYQDLNGPQMKSDVTVVLGYQYDF